MKKMLYICHVDWNWIKQRPHFIAEGLEKHFKLSVMYMRQNKNRKTLQKRRDNEFKARPIYIIPFFGRFPLLRQINNYFMAKQLSREYNKLKPDYIFLTYPDQIKLIPKKYTGKIIYDCMDDYFAMALNSRKTVIQNYERELIARADFVFLSSENLKDKIIEKYNVKDTGKFTVIRNGYAGEIFQVDSQTEKKQDEFIISYIGTVSHWFNFEYLLKSLEDFKNLRYRIIGPVESGLKIPESDRIDFIGTVEHSELYKNVKDTNCLIMPFVVNEIIESVDPVKLYEYINYNMNILCVKYNEILRFEDFVYFYSDYESFKQQLIELMSCETIKYSYDKRVEFLEKNNWGNRVNEVINKITK